jgi:GTP1/Obg family GTP-binding protein
MTKEEELKQFNEVKDEVVSLENIFDDLTKTSKEFNKDMKEITLDNGKLEEVDVYVKNIKSFLTDIKAFQEEISNCGDDHQKIKDVSKKMINELMLKTENLENSSYLPKDISKNTKKDLSQLLEYLNKEEDEDPEVQSA